MDGNSELNIIIEMVDGTVARAITVYTHLAATLTAGGPSDCSPTWCSRAQTISNATELRPVGMMTSAHTFDGSTNCTCIGRTVSRYL